MSNVSLRAAVRHIRNLAADQHAQCLSDRDLLAAFVAWNDQGAFTQILKRHGPMVLSVCRRLLHQEQDAEDAFQAAFLVLARKAAGIRKRESLGSWLHGVAYHMASDIRKTSARRRQHENTPTPSRCVPDPAWAVAWEEVQAILDGEIERLPPRYREPFVLCCLENKSCAEAARLLGQKEGTISSRLTRAREKLRERLTRRGVSLTGVLGTAAVAGNTAWSAVPAALVASTAQAATHLAATPATLATLVSPRVLLLLKGATRPVLVAPLKTATMVLAVTGLLTAGLGFPGLPRDSVAGRAGGVRALIADKHVTQAEEVSGDETTAFSRPTNAHALTGRQEPAVPPPSDSDLDRHMDELRGQAAALNAELKQAMVAGYGDPTEGLVLESRQRLASLERELAAPIRRTNPGGSSLLLSKGDSP
jgi:RNA polymerase sigma factor (sigma-70 family)